MTINLSKNETIRLEKSPGVGLTRVFMGLGWDVAQSKPAGGFLGRLMGGGGGDESIDLDASVIGYDANGREVGRVWFRELRGFNGAVNHSGDNRTGDGDGDDETIHVDLTRIPSDVKTLVFTVNSFIGQTFDKVANATCRLVDETNNKETARINLSAQGSHTGVILASLTRDGNGWVMKALNTTCNGRTLDDIQGDIRRLI
jgi:tellurium resistance protein TerZ